MGERDDKKPSLFGGGLPPATPAASPGQPTAAGGQKQDATTFAVLPRFEGAALMPESSGKLLTALRSQLSQLTIEHAGSGIRHEGGRYAVLPKTLRSAWMARVKHAVLGDLRFLFGQTRSTWVVVYDQPHERIYEDPRFMGIDFKLRDSARTSKGKAMYVSRIGKADLDKINAIAAQDSGDRTHADSLAPTEGAFSLDATLAKLAKCEIQGSSDPLFDLDAFVATIHFMTPTQAASGDYYYLEAGDPEAPLTCELHIKQDPNLPVASFSHKAKLRYKNEPSYLYIDIQYG